MTTIPTKGGQKHLSLTRTVSDLSKLETNVDQNFLFLFFASSWQIRNPVAFVNIERAYNHLQALLDRVDIWMGDHLDKIPCAVLLKKSGWRCKKTSITPSTSTTNVVLSFSRSQPDFEGFLRALRFPPSAKSTPSLFHLAILEGH